MGRPAGRAPGGEGGRRPYARGMAGEAHPLRAHMALCLLGFRGRGYSPAFVEAMDALQRELRASPGRAVRLVEAPDPLCGTCPNLTDGGCTLGGPDHEAHMRAQDRDVLDRLGLAPGAELAWGDVLERIGRSIRGTDLPGICTTCPWLGLGWCAEGVDALRRPAS